MKFLEYLVEIQKKYTFPLIFLAFLISFFFGFYAIRIETDQSLDLTLKPGDQYLTLKGLMKSEFNETDSFFVHIEIDPNTNEKDAIKDIRHPKVFESLLELENSLIKEPEINYTYSVASILNNTYRKLPDSLDESKNMINQIGGKEKVLLNKHNKSAIMFISVNIPESNEGVESVQNKIEEKLRVAAKPKGVTFTLTGMPTIMNRIMKLLISDNINTVLLSLVFVFIVLYFIFKDTKMAVITMIPVILTLVWLVGTMRILNIKISVMTAAIGAMMVGMGIDYGIHISNGFLNAYKKKHSNPLMYAIKDIGGALTISFFTTLAGFSTMLFVDTPATVLMGMALSFGILYAFTSTMLVLPLFLKLELDYRQKREKNE